MKKAQLIVAGIGPGSPEDITPAVIQAVKIGRASCRERVYVLV